MPSLIREASLFTLLQEGLKLHHERGNTPGLIHCLETLGKVAASQGNAERAARLWGAAAALRDGAGAPLPPRQRNTGPPRDALRLR